MITHRGFDIYIEQDHCTGESPRDWEPTEGNAFSTLSGDLIASAIVNESGSYRNK